MSSTLRSRPTTTPSSNSSKPSSPSEKPLTSTSADDEPTRLSLLDILRVLAGLLLLSTTLSYYITGTSLTWNYRPAFTRPARILAYLRGPVILTDKQLARYDGTDTALPIYVALNGSIYDVSASPHLYGPGGSYHFFAGRDATRAFVTGCFAEDLTGDLRGVEEMFMPVEDTTLVEGAEASANGKVTVMATKEQKREGKLRREREVRTARKKVQETVDGWRRMFDGGKGGKYFWVGRVERGAGSGWEGWGEARGLCESARKGRPRRTAGEV